jgi:hypothetical protein
MANGRMVNFPENYDKGVLCATLYRNNIKEEIFTSREAIDAVKNGQPIPYRTIVTLVDYRDGKFFHYVVMEKREGWGKEYSPELRNGEWEYQAFNADKSVNVRENLSRCFSCHKSQGRNDFVFTLDEMKSVE